MKRIIFLFLVAVIHVAYVASIPRDIDPPIPCKNTSDCRTPKLPKNATCEHDICMCYDQQNKSMSCSSLQAGNVNHGKTHSAVGHVCKVDQDCFLDHGICNKTNSQCACAKGYVPSNDKHSCVEERSLGDSCVDDGQCSAKVPNSTCMEKMCACKTGYHHVDGKCIESIAFGMPCVENMQCSHIEGGICDKDHICGCKSNETINMDHKRCLQMVHKILDQCTETAQCVSLPGTMCIEKKCRCKDNEHYVSLLSTCIVNKALGDHCNHSNECYQDEAEPNALKCFDNRCECNDDFYERETKCVKGDAISLRGSLFVTVLTICVGGLLA